MSNTDQGNASVQVFSIVDPGHCYDLMSFGGQGIHQRINFLKKTPVNEGDTELKTVYPGTTNEAVVLMLINRLEFLEAQLPDGYTHEAIAALHVAMGALNNRTRDRVTRGVEGTNKA